MKLFVRLDDIDRHGEGCECGDCDSNGKSYGAGIYTLRYPDDCEAREYACNEQEAIRRAEQKAFQHGELVPMPGDM